MADLVLLLLLLLALFGGWRAGTINVLAKFGSIIVAYQCARLFSGMLATYFTGLFPFLNPGTSESTFISLLGFFVDVDAAANRALQVVLFIILFILVRKLVCLLANLLTSIFNVGVLGVANRFVGAVVSLLLMMIVIVVVVNVVLPTCIAIGFGEGVLVFMEGSNYVLPVLNSLQALI